MILLDTPDYYLNEILYFFLEIYYWITLNRILFDFSISENSYLFEKYLNIIILNLNFSYF